MTGTLFGIGLGPGDPDLLTLRAARLIGAAEVIAYPALPASDSFARSIAARHIRPGAAEMRLEIPMTPERGPAQAAYDRGAAEIAAVLEMGRDVAFLCEGDPLFFGSFMYVMARLSRRFSVEVVPGVTSTSAAAAAAGRPLVARNESLAVIPAPLSEPRITAALTSAETVAILKLGRHLGRVRDIVERLGLGGRAVYVEHATLASERVLPLAEAPDPAPYFSMILITKGADPWL